jgi:hypothetical protein
MTTRQVSTRLGHRNSATTRAWLARYEIQATGRVTGSGEKIYNAAEIEAAIARMPIGPANVRYRNDHLD